MEHLIGIRAANQEEVFFCRPIEERIAFSIKLLSIRTCPRWRIRYGAVHCPSKYVHAFTSFDSGHYRLS